MTDARVLCWVWSDRISNLETQIRIDNIQEICVKGELKDKSSNVEGLLLRVGCYPFENKNIDPGYNYTKIISILEWGEEIQSKTTNFTESLLLCTNYRKVKKKT